MIAVAAIQASFGHDMEANIAKVEGLVREAARGAQVVLPPELFQGIYFPTQQDPKWFATAHPVNEHPCVLALGKLAKELERRHPHLLLREGRPALFQQRGDGRRRRRNPRRLPQEPYPRRAGLSWRNTISAPATPASRRGDRAGTIGVGICWDQWYPEAARAMMLTGAEILLYPTAIGSEPQTDPRHRMRRGSAPCKAMRSRTPCRSSPPTASALRRTTGDAELFYGHSFIADHSGELVASFGAEDEGVLVAIRSRRIGATAPTGASSATAAPTSTPRASFNRSFLAYGRSPPQMAALAAVYGAVFGRNFPSARSSSTSFFSTSLPRTQASFRSCSVRSAGPPAASLHPGIGHMRNLDLMRLRGESMRHRSSDRSRRGAGPWS